MKKIIAPTRKKIVSVAMVLSFILLPISGICQDDKGTENACNQKLLAHRDARVTLEKDETVINNQALFEVERIEEEIEIENWMFDTGSWNKYFPNTFKNNRMEAENKEGEKRLLSLDFLDEAPEGPLKIEAWMSDVSRWNE